MKKLLVIAAFFMLKSSGPIMAQTLEIKNGNSCGATLNFNIVAYDATSACPVQLTSITLAAGTFFGPEQIHDFDAGGSGSSFWVSGGTIGAGAHWGLSQTIWSGVGGATIGSSTWTCWAGVPLTNTIGTAACVVNLLWSETPSGDVSIAAY